MLRLDFSCTCWEVVTGGFIDKTVGSQDLHFGWILLVAERMMAWGKEGIQFQLREWPEATAITQISAEARATAMRVEVRGVRPRK